MVGNISNFSKYDVLRCFLRLEGRASRQELAKELGLGEGTIRSILDILKEKGFLDSTKKGHFLSEKGQAELEKMKKSVSETREFTLDRMYKDCIKFGIILKGARIGLETYKLRDAAVKSGAEGAVIFKYNNKLDAPGTEYINYFSDIEKIFSLEKDDVLVVSFAKDARHAETGAFAVSVELDNNIKNFIKEVG
jgi:DNA-binding transcriptional MocR family regulator